MSAKGHTCPHCGNWLADEDWVDLSPDGKFCSTRCKNSGQTVKKAGPSDHQQVRHTLGAEKCEEGDRFSKPVAPDQRSVSDEMQVTRTCDNCGSPLTGRRRRFCSDECCRAFHRPGCLYSCLEPIAVGCAQLIFWLIILYVVFKLTLGNTL